MRTLAFFLGCLSSLGIFAQSICGYVRDAASGEGLPDVVVYSGSQSTLSNSYGYYSIVSADSIVFTSVGYRTHVAQVADAIDGHLDVMLAILSEDIKEVEVHAPTPFRRDLSLARMSRHNLSAADVKRLPVMFGEPDAIKSLQFLPGVNSVSDGSVNMSVRGGTHDQNLILVDEATVYNPSHCLGLFTAFSPDAISDVDFYKSCAPAKYGGKLSAVVDMHMREGNTQRLAMSGGVGTISSRLMLETPLRQGKSGLMVTGRFGYGDLVNAIADYNDYAHSHNNDIVRFYDVCAKANWLLSPDDRLFVSAYRSHDDFLCEILSQDNRQEWGNTTGSLRWNHIISSSMFANFTSTFSDYHYLQQQQRDVRDFEWKAWMKEAVVKADFDSYLSHGHLSFGASASAHFYNPGQIDPLGPQSVMLPRHLKHKQSTVLAAYLGDELKFGGRFNLNVGLRLSAGAAEGNLFGGMEPRAALSYSPLSVCSFKLSYGRSVQYEHMLTNSALSMPTDVWLPISSHISPQTDNTWAVGSHAMFGNFLDLSCEAYVKSQRHVVEFRDNANLYLNEDVDAEVVQGRGRAYGLELLLSHHSRLVSAQASYTLSKSQRKVPGVNANDWFYSVYDQRHHFVVNTSLHLGREEVGLAFRYHTGGRTTLPSGTFSVWGVSLSQYTERNGYVMPDFHRLDFSYTHNFKKNVGRRWQSQLVFSVYNCYARRNAYSMFVEGDSYNLSEPHVYQLYLYKVVPSLTYNFKF